MGPDGSQPVAIDDTIPTILHCLKFKEIYTEIFSNKPCRNNVVEGGFVHGLVGTWQYLHARVLHQLMFAF
jgi:hypothetical protein